MTSPLHMLTWLGHSSFRISGSRTVYVDPYRLGDGPRADLILITHSHYDHCSPEDVARITGPGTVIVAEKSCQKKLAGDVRIVAPGDRLELDGVGVEAVAAYNVGKKFHPRKNGWLGYILELDGVRFYHAGDTDHIPEMAAYRADVALLPVSGTYVMTADEAAAAARDIRPRVAVPMHYGTLVGEEGDALRLRELLAGEVEVAILPR